MYLSVAFIQMLKAGTPVVVMAMLSLTGVEYMSPPVALSTVVMALGTVMTSLGEVNWHTLGFTLMMLSELAEAGRCVITQHILKVRPYARPQFSVVHPDWPDLFKPSLLSRVARLYSCAIPRTYRASHLK